MSFKHLSQDDNLKIDLQKSDLFSAGLTILKLAVYIIDVFN